MLGLRDELEKIVKLKNIEKEPDIDFPVLEVIKIKTKFKVFYYNPTSGKWNFLHTTCVNCGKKALIRKKNIGIGGLGSREFIYCNDCKIEGVVNTKKFVFCPKLHLIENRAVFIKKKDKYFYCQICGGSYLIIDCKVSENERL
jgi:hypothetical protein